VDVPVAAGVVAVPPEPPSVAVVGVVPALTPALVAVVDVVEVVELVELEVVVVAEAATPGAPVGTVNGGAPCVFNVVVPPPPQALTPTAMMIAAVTTVAVLSIGARTMIFLGPEASGAKRFHAPAAVRAVVEVLLRELVTPIAKAEVLDRPRELRGRRRQGQQLGDDFERLTRLPVDVYHSGLGFDDDLATGRGRPHPVLLAGPHLRAMLPAARASLGSRVIGGGATMPHAGIECGAQRMVKALARTPRSLAALIPGALVVLALSGCSLKHPTANLVNGKKMFVSTCGSCHTLAHAGTTGAVGPNLDDAFRQDRADGVKGTSIQGLVDFWIQYPNTEGVMPAMLLKGQDAQDVAAYVGLVAGRPGQDTGSLAAAVPSVSQQPAVEKNGVVEINADPTGQLKFTAPSASATAGKVTLRMENKSSVMHDIAITGGGVNMVGQIVSNGGVSMVTAALKPGTYTFYCSVDDHRQAGMQGTLTVK
jgi:plastocyanin